MLSFEIIQFINNNLSEIVPNVLAFANTVIAVMGLRIKKNTSTKELEKVKAGKIDEIVSELIDSGTLTFTELYKAKNFLDIAKKADAYRAKKGTIEPIRPQNFDWHIRFYDACGNSADEDMQEIWARILSGEIDHPGGVSMRTLDCLRNLSKEEAQLFQKVCKASVVIGRSTCLLRIDDLMGKNGITYDDVLRLEDCGLMKSDVGNSVTLLVSDSFRMITNDERYALLVKKREGIVKTLSRLDIPHYLFTRSGSDLFPVVGGSTDIEELCSHLQNEFQDYEFECGQVIKNENGKVTYSLIKVVIESNYVESGSNTSG